MKSEGVCFMFTEDGDNEQKETESNKNETTAGASEKVVTEQTEVEENPTLNVEIQETETGVLGPETMKLCAIITKESHGVPEDTKRNITEDSDDREIEDSDSESEINRSSDKLESTSGQVTKIVPKTPKPNKNARGTLNPNYSTSDSCQ